MSKIAWRKAEYDEKSNRLVFYRPVHAQNLFMMRNQFKNAVIVIPCTFTLTGVRVLKKAKWPFALSIQQLIFPQMRAVHRCKRFVPSVHPFFLNSICMIFLDFKQRGKNLKNKIWILSKKLEHWCSTYSSY